MGPAFFEPFCTSVLSRPSVPLASLDHEGQSLHMFLRPPATPSPHPASCCSPKALGRTLPGSNMLAAVPTPVDRAGCKLQGFLSSLYRRLPTHPHQVASLGKLSAFQTPACRAGLSPGVDSDSGVGRKGSLQPFPRRGPRFPPLRFFPQAEQPSLSSTELLPILKTHLQNEFPSPCPWSLLQHYNHRQHSASLLLGWE